MNRWFWIACIVIVSLFFYLTKGILLPFLAGLAVAYFLDPVADWLEARNVPRGAAAALVIVLFFLALVGIVVALFPIFSGQFVALAETLPQTVANLRPWFNEQVAWLNDSFGINLASDLDGILTGVSDTILEQARSFAAGAVRGGLALFSVLSLVLISPVVAFYLLRDWDLIVEKVDGWLPTANAGVVREQMRKIDEVLAGFVRGQLLVSTAMGAMYGIGWTFVGLDFGLVLGVLAGIMSIVPFAGALFAAIVAIAVAIGQWGFDVTQVALVGGVFLVVQTIESAFLTPRLMGERVGLHPVWVLFAVFAGGEVMGFVGVLIAVPAAAAIAVLVRFVIDKYLEHYQDPAPAPGLSQSAEATPTETPPEDDAKDG